jgi:hypothetical protein
MGGRGGTRMGHVSLSAFLQGRRCRSQKGQDGRKTRIVARGSCLFPHELMHRPCDKHAPHPLPIITPWSAPQQLHPHREPAPCAPPPPCCCCATPRRHRGADDPPLGHRQLRARRLCVSRRPHRRGRRSRQAHRHAPPHAEPRAAHPGHRRHPRGLRRTGRAARPPCRRPPGERRRHRRDGPHAPPAPPLPTSARRAGWCWRPTRSSPSRTGSPTATCPSASTCPFWWRACPKARCPRPTRASSSSPAGCAPPTRSRGTRRAPSS